jgi:hypothetical protein
LEVGVLNDGAGDAPVGFGGGAGFEVAVDLVERGKGFLSEDEESADVATWGEAENVELVDVKGVDAGDVSECSYDTVVLGIHDAWSEFLDVLAVAHLTSASSHASGSVDSLDINQLNVLRLAPGGHVGRFLVFTQEAFASLDKIYGDFKAGTSSKANWSIPGAVIQNADLQALMQSDEIQSALNAPKTSDTIKRSCKKNPLTNIRAMLKLNPNAATEKRAAWRVEAASKKAKTA